LVGLTCVECRDVDGEPDRVVAFVVGETEDASELLALAAEAWKRDHAGHEGVLVAVVPSEVPR
jgi:hypothetical protein